jgi:hypothetical protein
VDIPTGTLTFGSSVGQKINLWADQYAIGIQAGTQFYRTANEFCWYLNGKFSATQGDPGPGGTLLMSLDNTGSLRIPGDINFGTTERQMLNLWSNNYGIGIQDNTLYQRSDFDFCWFRGGAHANGRSNPGGGALAMKLDSSSNLTVSGNVTVAGNLHVNGSVSFAPTAAQNLIRIETRPFAQSMNGATTPRSWTANYNAFQEVYAAYVVMQGFSIWNNDGNPSFSNSGNDQSTAAIPQHVFVRIIASDKTQTTGECFCSESLKGNETDNTVLFTLVVIGRP